MTTPGRIYRRGGLRLPPPSSELDAREMLLASLRDHAESVRLGFTDPDDDWTLTFFVVSGSGQITALAGGDVEKPDLVRAVAEFSRKVGAVAVGHIASSWALLPPELSGSTMSDERYKELCRGLSAGRLRIAHMPERVEALLVAVYTALTARLELAPILRDGARPPTLGSWRVFGDSDRGDGQIGGAMAGPLRESLLRVG